MKQFDWNEADIAYMKKNGFWKDTPENRAMEKALQRDKVRLNDSTKVIRTEKDLAKKVRKPKKQKARKVQKKPKKVQVVTISKKDYAHLEKTGMANRPGVKFRVRG